MLDIIANIVIIVLVLYTAIGLIFYIGFIKKGVHKIDGGVKSASIFMKALLLPGTIALWPILLKKIKKEGQS